jgi:Holliday junction resolvasome RuvABC DNA-binding subunit
MLPDTAIFTGRGNMVSYEPEAKTMADLGYRRNDIARAVTEVVAQFRSAQ